MKKNITYSCNDINSIIDRNVCCLLGLPFDIVNMDDVITKIEKSIINHKPFFISTPNLNFLMSSQRDNLFRDSVINSDLSIADGAPIIWLAHLLGISLPERLAGSDLIEHLVEGKCNTAISVFFFGGDENIAKKACEKLNSINSKIKCDGFFYPGFGTIDEMSKDEIIKYINDCAPDFVIVSLGAKKGQAWIERNRHKLNSPVISHLGAVVNFIAGTVNRAPKYLQKVGLEWLWRIKEEPLLWRRYFYDGLLFVYLLFTRVLPLLVLIKLYSKRSLYEENTIITIDDEASAQLTVSGYWGKEKLNTIQNKLINILSKDKINKIHIIFEKGSYIDGHILAKMQLISNFAKNNNKELSIETKSKLVKKIIYFNCCEEMIDHK